MKYEEIREQITARLRLPTGKFVSRPSGRRRVEWDVTGGLVELIERPICVVLRATRDNEDHDELEWTVTGRMESGRVAPHASVVNVLADAESFLRQRGMR